MKNAPFKRTDVYLDFIGVLSTDYTKKSSTAEICEAVRAMLETNADNARRADADGVIFG